jgi:hypothetical protein
MTIRLEVPPCHEPRKGAPLCCCHWLAASHPAAPIICCKGRPEVCLWDAETNEQPTISERPPRILSVPTVNGMMPCPQGQRGEPGESRLSC